MPVDLAHVAWADEIVVMDHEQRSYIANLQSELKEQGRGFTQYNTVPVHNFDIPDDYGFREPWLIKKLTEKAYEVFSTKEE